MAGRKHGLKPAYGQRLFTTCCGGEVGPLGDEDIDGFSCQRGSRHRLDMFRTH